MRSLNEKKNVNKRYKSYKWIIAMKKLSKPTRYAKLRNLSVWLVLLGIVFIIYNFGANNDTEVAINSFWSDSVNLETNIPDDVLAKADKIVIIDKTVIVDVSIIHNVCVMTREALTVSRP